MLLTPASPYRQTAQFQQPMPYSPAQMLPHQLSGTRLLQQPPMQMQILQPQIPIQLPQSQVATVPTIHHNYTQHIEVPPLQKTETKVNYVPQKRQVTKMVEQEIQEIVPKEKTVVEYIPVQTVIEKVPQPVEVPYEVKVPVPVQVPYYFYSNGQTQLVNPNQAAFVNQYNMTNNIGLGGYQGIPQGYQGMQGIPYGYQQPQYAQPTNQVTFNQPSNDNRDKIVYAQPTNSGIQQQSINYGQPSYNYPIQNSQQMQNTYPNNNNALYQSPNVIPNVQQPVSTTQMLPSINIIPPPQQSTQQQQVPQYAPQQVNIPRQMPQVLPYAMSADSSEEDSSPSSDDDDNRGTFVDRYRYPQSKYFNEFQKKFGGSRGYGDSRGYNDSWGQNDSSRYRQQYDQRYPQQNEYEQRRNIRGQYGNNNGYGGNRDRYQEDNFNYNQGQKLNKNAYYNGNQRNN